MLAKRCAYVAAVAMSGLLFTGVVAAKPKAAAKPKPAAKSAASTMPESGFIRYQISGSMMSGTIDFVWTSGGKKFRQDTHATVKQPGGPPLNIEAWTIGDGKYIYMHQPIQGPQVTRTSVAKAQAGSPVPVPGTNSKGLGKVVGKATVLGKPCEIRDVGYGKIWMWRGVALKMDASMQPGQTMKMTAIKLSSPFRVPAGAFKVPSGYKIVDGNIHAGTAVPGAKSSPKPAAKKK